MGRRSFHRKYLSATTAVVLLGVTLIVIPSCSYAAASVSTYSKNFYQHQPHSFANTSGAVFEPRGDVGGGGGGGGGSSYSVPVASGSSFGSSGGGYSMGGGGGGYDMGGGGYGAPAMASPAVYKYQIYPSPAMQMQSYGWGGEEEDDDFGGGPKELLGLLGLKGLKGLKPLKGALVLLKGLLLLKKLLGIPLFPILLPLLLPLFLLKLALLLLPLLLILLIPVPVITTGRKQLESPAGQSFKKYLQDKMDSVMANLPEDISHIVEKIKGSSADLSLSKLLTGYSESVGTARGNTNKATRNNFRDLGSNRSKVVYVASTHAANIKPSAKSAKFTKKIDKNPTSTKVTSGSSKT